MLLDWDYRGVRHGYKSIMQTQFQSNVALSVASVEDEKFFKGDIGEFSVGVCVRILF